MDNYPATPQALIRTRFTWLRDSNFSAIYRSYHSEARFREHFPREEEYLRFAREQHLAEIELLRMQIVTTQLRGKLAKILTFQVYRLHGQLNHYLDITTLRLHDGRWQVLFGKRVTCDAQVDLEHLGWDAVEGHPEAITY